MAATKKRALITGGGSGIGLAIARAYAAEGIDVTIAGRSVEKLKETGLPHIQLDVTDEAGVKNAIHSSGPFDIFVANAGAAMTAPALKTPREIWDKMIAVNLTSVYLCSQAALPSMVERGWGRFIAIASTTSFKAYPYAGAYGTAKHGVIGWIKSLAVELAKTGVTVNAICPGYTETPLIDEALEKITAKTGISREQAIASMTKQNPMERFITPEEVADAALWLAGEKSASVNGQAIVIDGGETAR